MDNSKFLENIETKIYGRNLTVFDEIDSTNKYALNELESGKILEEGSAYIALRQTSAIGTSGNVWESYKPMGMWLSLILNSPSQKSHLSFIPAIAMGRMLREKYSVNAHLKWPNDVLINNKKISGILLQAKYFSENNIVFVLGVGLNILQETNDFSQELQNKATSLKIETGHEYKLEDVYKNYVKYFEDVYTNNNLAVIDEWLKYSNMIDKIITINKNKEIIKARVLSITDEGFLRIKNIDNNKIETIEARAGIDIDANY